MTTPAAPQRWFAEHAWLPSGPARDVTIEVTEGFITSVTSDTDPVSAVRLPGVVLPGFANNHSHAFHRALRGRTHDASGTFWTWRERMYAVANRLTPDSYLALARATYAEMALAGVTSVGEFHYLHHAPGGRRYDDPNAMAEALRQAASDAGVRLTLLDACYIAGGLKPAGHVELDETQKRFSDGDADAWAARVATLKGDDRTRVGAAIHSIRAVPREQLGTVADAATGAPLHVHLSEQLDENTACQLHYGCSPTELLDRAAALGDNATAVHATHLGDNDIRLIARARTSVCFCPTTERDLADGIGPARKLADAGVRLSLGSDQHAVIDLLEEARALEMHERLTAHQRGRFTQQQLIDGLTDHRPIGWPDAGRLAPGARADVVAVRLDTVRTVGTDPGQILMSATAADIDTVMVDGQVVVADGQHRLGDVAVLLNQAIRPLWSDV